MESKRLGLCHKSLFVVPNHLIEQWSGEFLRLYPSANILVATKKDFEPKNRKKFCARIATGEYDAVIIGHSQFEKIPVSMERQQRLLAEQIFEVEEGLRELKSQRAERFTIKSLERTKRGLEAKLKKLQDSSRKDDVVTFEQLGVDRLYVDEAHNYKNLFLYTKMRNVAGLSATDAQKSSDMLLKCRYIDEITDSRGVVFATGTPVSNSMTELYTMMRYLQHDAIRGKGLAHFDCWASTFGETQTAIELAPEGTGYRARTRFAKFFNLPELMTLFKEAADIKTSDQLNLPTPTPIYDECIARVIVPKAVKRGKVFGDVFEINYREQAANVAQNSVAPDHDRLTFADGFVLEAPCCSSFDAAMALVGEHGGVQAHRTLPKDADALAEVLTKQKSRRDRLPETERTEALSPLPVAELRKYEAVKKAHPDALVCFAQNGYFELYGKDAEKAAPLLGTKLLEKKVRGKPSMPVTGFRETAWVAASKKLWQSGADVFLSKDGETFKELKAADYIPVGATLNVDGIKCRIDAVNFAADEVRLTNIEDKNRPIRFSESIQYIRSYVEDAGTAIYDTIPKKPAARESIRDKLKSAQKAQPPHTPKPQKNKGKDMEL